MKRQDKILLELINRLDAARLKEIVKDDPDFGARSKKGRGISLSVAKAVVARNAAQAFTSVDELLEVRGLGKDTLHDMRWSVSQMPLRTRAFWTIKADPVMFQEGAFRFSTSRLENMIELAMEASDDAESDAWAEVEDEEWEDLEMVKPEDPDNPDEFLADAAGNDKLMKLYGR